MIVFEEHARKMHSNNTKGVMKQPDYSTDPSNQPRTKNFKLNFATMYGEGEGAIADEVTCVTANGISRSKGEGNNQRMAWSAGRDGDWNRSVGWPGGNRTGE